jgi:lipopolysaccharide transport system permease protein
MNATTDRPAKAVAAGSPFRRLVELHTVLVLKGIRSRYQATVLGLAWTLVNPLLFAGVLIFLLQNVLEMNTRRFSSYVYIGVLTYGWFRGAVSQATRAVISSRMLARRPGFPPAVLPLVPVTANLFDFILSIPVLIVVLSIGGSEFSWPLIVFPIFVLNQFLITVGLSYLAAAGHLMFRDIGQVIDLLLTFGFFLTPIFYSMSQIPENLKPYFWLNPLVPLLDGYRTILIDGNWPSVQLLLGTTLFGVVICGLGWYVFRAASTRYIEDV